MAEDPFAHFLADLERATNETQKRELFVALAATGFGETGFATALALGAEYQVHFSEAGLVRRGAIDSFFGSLIIEFEADLARTRDHALDQLRGYVAGAWREDGSAARPYLAVASDGRRWEIYSPRLTDPAGSIDADNVTLDGGETWEPAGDATDGQSFRDFINRLFFRHDMIRPTADNFARDFGLSSPAYLRARQALVQKLAELDGDSELGVKRNAWHVSLQIAYGSVETDDELFAKHTYLAVLARLLVWASLEHRHLEERELDGVLNGQYFVGRRIANLVEDDFFLWHEIPSLTEARRTWLALARHLAGYDLSAVAEDILKPLYEELVDPVTRQVLGEFYTPDWLATRLTERLLADWDWTLGVPAVVDPACGSGTFLRTTIDYARGRRRDAGQAATLEEILGKVVGIDVHPLAVTIARATYLLAIRDLVLAETNLVTLPVYLANSLRSRGDVGPTLFGAGTIALQVEAEDYEVPVEFVHDGPVFDATLDAVLSVARSYGRSTDDLGDVSESVRGRLGRRLVAFSDADVLVDTLGRLARDIAERIRSRRDSVFGFLLKNNYRPAMLRQSFDYVIGNPPWLTVGDISTGDYKALVVRLGTEANIAPRDTGEQSHTELATIFLCQAATEFLSPDTGRQQPRIGLVMPRSLFSATHHRLLREGAYTPRFAVKELWDLERVSPLFKVPACAVLASGVAPSPREPIPGNAFAGRLPRKDLPWAEAEPNLTIESCEFRLRFLGERSAWIRVGDEGELVGTLGPTRGGNVYEGAFRQGAILYPQALLVVSGDGAVRRGMGSVAVRTDPRAVRNARLLRDVTLRQVVDSENLYTTAAAEHLLPYALAPELWMVVLPTVHDPTHPEFGSVAPTQLRRAGRVDTAGWLEWAELQWERVRKPGETRALHERIDYLGQLSAQAERHTYLVLYTSSGSRPVAAAVDTATLPLPFVARDKTYWASFSSPAEADFLAAFLNSGFVSERIEDWQTRGLFGARDVHKRPLDVVWPAFDPANPNHEALARTSASLRSQAAGAVGRLPNRDIGAQRAFVRAQLAVEDLAEVERLVATISVTRTAALVGTIMSAASAEESRAGG